MMKSFPEACWNSGCGVRDVWLREVWDFELCGFSEVKRLDDQVLELIVELLSTRVRFIFQGFAYSARALDYTMTRVPRSSFADLRSPSLLEKKLAPSQLCLWASATAPATVNFQHVYLGLIVSRAGNPRVCWYWEVAADYKSTPHVGPWVCPFDVRSTLWQIVCWEAKTHLPMSYSRRVQVRTYHQYKYSSYGLWNIIVDRGIALQPLQVVLHSAISDFDHDSKRLLHHHIHHA